MAPKEAFRPDAKKPEQAAAGRPVGMGGPNFADVAPRLLDLGYEPLPIVPQTKRPAPSRWTSGAIDEARVEDWVRRHPACGVGLRTGALIGLDIDILDADLAHRIQDMAERRLGETLLRVGLWPKRLLLYRTDTPRPKVKLPGVEVLGRGQQFVAFGIHPDTGGPYAWPLGDTPLDVALSDLPLVSEGAVEGCLAEVAAHLPAPGIGTRRQASSGAPGAGSQVTREKGRVVDGRDGWLSTIAFHAVHDAIDARETLDPGVLVDRVWRRFRETTDLDRPRKDGRLPYAPADARQKVADKLRLLRDDRMPSRKSNPPEAPPPLETLDVDAARVKLDQTLGEACSEILAWRADGETCPRIGIRATVGLGKSTLAQRQLMELRSQLQAIGAPDRIAMFTPSHALAEECAGKWRDLGLRTAVLRGYEARDPASGRPMCEDIDAVRASIRAGMDVHATACDDGEGHRCAFLSYCPKQANRRDIAEADVVVAAYDALWTGFAVETSSIGVIVIDEACWPRAIGEAEGVVLETFRNDGLIRGTPGAMADRADLDAFRGRAVEALLQAGPGLVRGENIADSGLTPDDCRLAASLESRRLRDPGLRPGLDQETRRRAASVIAANDRIRRYRGLWSALADLLTDVGGRIRLRLVPDTGGHEVIVSGLSRLHPSLSDKPILHLDATLRPELAAAVLPGLTVTQVAASAPHMTLRLITGGFGKSALIQAPSASPEENRRRARKLDSVVRYVTWEARRAAPGRTLVITYKDCEAAFLGVPGVEIAHFNAIAGLDVFRNAALLIVVGRPLPRDSALPPIAGALFGREVATGYRQVRKGVLMRDGSVREVSTIEHADPQAEILRAAICDDELIQAVGRGRAVNRSADNPLEVQVLADVALPLVHDALAPWELVAPDCLQRMLLAGLAVDSPADAALLHPALFGAEKQAQKAFEREGFKRQIPIRDTHRGMSLKYAAYRRPGRGRGWADAYWLDGDEQAAHARLTTAIGALAEWRPR